MLYDDESTETSFDVKDIYSYAYYNASNKNKGMRGCFVYNPKGSTNSGGEGANLFFPVGASGYGRRKTVSYTHLDVYKRQGRRFPTSPMP